MSRPDKPFPTIVVFSLLFALPLMACTDTKGSTTAGPEKSSPVAHSSVAVKPVKVNKETPNVTNPFFADSYNTPYGMPPFERIKPEHYLPAFEKGMKDQLANIKKITDSKAAPTFANTIDALEQSGDLLTRTARVFFNITAANTSDKLQAIKKQIAPRLSKHNDAINFNTDLFKRVKALYDMRAKLTLTGEQAMVLKQYYKGFVRGGALLSDADQKKLGAINKELSMAKLKYNENLLKEIMSFKMVIDKKEDLAGLPRSVIDAAAVAAKGAKLEGKWLFTVKKPSWIPFVTYSTKRKLREKLYKAYINKGNNNNEFDNKKLMSKIAALRVRKAKLMGFTSWAHYKLDDNMAKTPDKVMALLNKLWKAALPMAKREARALQRMIRKEKQRFKLQSWDWWYYTEKLRKQRYAIDDEKLRPYFKLENVRAGVFHVANKLFGLTFRERHDLPKYHKEVQTFEVLNASGKVIGIYLADYFPRPGKRGGAWMSPYRKQHRRNGKDILPVITNVCNFSRPIGDKPSLLSFEEVITLFHEFGHALHGLLSECSYEKVSGTDTALDFVELPSQLMEHWALEPAVLAVYAKHYKTGEVIPAALVEKIKKSKHFNQGFETAEYLAAALLDLEWHTQTTARERNTAKFERAFLKKIGLIPEIISRYRSTYFAHVVGGYSAGYYSYIWAAVLDNDVYAAFQEKKDIFHKETAEKFRKYILSRGGSEEAMTLYKKFRGAEPSIEPLLRNRGLK